MVLRFIVHVVRFVNLTVPIKTAQIVTALNIMTFVIYL